MVYANGMAMACFIEIYAAMAMGRILLTQTHLPPSPALSPMLPLPLISPCMLQVLCNYHGMMPCAMHVSLAWILQFLRARPYAASIEGYERVPECAELGLLRLVPAQHLLNSTIGLIPYS